MFSLFFFFFLFETISDKHRIGHTFISAMKESIWWKVEDIDIRADNLGYSVVRKEREKRDKGFHFESIVGFIGKVFSFFFFLRTRKKYFYISTVFYIRLQDV